MKAKTVFQIDNRFVARFVCLLMSAVGWTILFSTEYLFNQNHEYDGEKILRGLILVPVFLLLGWLVIRFIDPLRKTIPSEHIRTWLIWSGIAGVIILCFFLPSSPLFNAFHTLDITAPKTGTVEISAIKKMDGELISSNDVLLSGEWVKDGNTFLSSPTNPGTLHFEGNFKGGLTIDIRDETSTGMPIVIWDQTPTSSISDSDDSSIHSITLPGFTWNSLSIGQKAITAGLVIFDWIGLSAGIFLALMLTKRKANDSSMVFYLLVFSLAAFLNIQAFSQASPRSFGDTLDYLGRGLLVINGDHVCCQRPFVVPGVYQLLVGNTNYITGFQLAFSMVSWTILAASLTTLVSNSTLKKFAFAFILFFSLSTSINQWNKALLSESLTFSLTALLIAGWIIYLKTPRWQSVVALGIVTILWNFTRYTNNYLTLMITAGLFLILILKKSWRNTLNVSLLVIYLSISIWGLIDSKSSQGWVPSYGNVLIQRILPDEEATEYFARAGMPVHPAVDVFEKNHLAATDDWTFFRRADLQGLRFWINEKGMSTFMQYLLSHPQKAFGAFWDARDAYLSGWDPGNSYVPKGYQSPLGKWLNLADIPYSARNLIAFSIIVSGFTAYCFLRRKYRDERLWLPIFLILSTLPVFFISYHSDTNDIARHALMSGFQLRLGLWMVMLFLLDGFLNQKISEEKRSLGLF